MKRPYRPPTTVCSIRRADLARLHEICGGKTEAWSTPDLIALAIDAAAKFYGTPGAKIQGESVLEIKAISQQLSLFP